tara:strand:+ start:694 stop:972 length:279 start_codon:yes stop_codon:yes gene_type:complete
MKFKVDQIHNNLFKVFINDSVDSLHLVTVSDKIFQKLTKNKITKKKLIQLSFEFLLKREKNTQIFREFEIQVISEYFPDYLDNLKLWCDEKK